MLYLKILLYCERHSTLYIKRTDITTLIFNHAVVRSSRFSTDNTEKHNKRFNPINIQMLSANLFNQIFFDKPELNISKTSLTEVMQHLKKHNLWGANTKILSDVKLQLPHLHNQDIISHFDYIASEQLKDYKSLILEFLKSELPPLPSHWNFNSGWTKYDSSGANYSVEYPEESALVFDVEVCMQEGNFPTIATAVSKNYWYLWCSDRLTDDLFSWSKNISLSDLIPLESRKAEIHTDINWQPKIVIGHNVAFDRTFIKEQYFLEPTKTLFLDTMSLHICVSGLTGMQRAMSLASKKKTTENNANGFLDLSMGWTNISSLNNLADVYKLYCKEEISKAEREIFISGSLSDVKEKFQECATYCAQDTQATFKVLKAVMPLFLERFPHPVTLCGLLEMSSAYLPVNQNWQRYLEEAQSTYDDLQKEMKLSLVHLANEACAFLKNDLYKKDPWLWDLDWSVQSLKFKKVVEKSNRKSRKKKNVTTNEGEVEKSEERINFYDQGTPDALKNLPKSEINPYLKKLFNTATNLRKVRPFLPGYPAWFRELCDKKGTDSDDWESGPYLISTQMRSVPKLMRLMWDGYPVHYDAKHGWGYLVPDEKAVEFPDATDFPFTYFLQLLKHSRISEKHFQESAVQEYMSVIREPQEDKKELSKLWESLLGKDKSQNVENMKNGNFGNGPHVIGIPGVVFYRLPHKDGPHKRVGNPLSKDFLPKVEDNTLRTFGKGQADRALLLSKMLSYWKNSHGRILSQMVVWLKHEELPESLKRNDKYDASNSYGAILPRLIPAGTVTRRAVEPTWLTASNAYEDRVGSELKAMIQTPPGYHFVGADVDSQELWLAAILGDSQFAGMHGCTAFGWMTLQGKKSEGTDMHSKTATSIGVSRDQAKVLNYARIYGAGKSFAQRLMMQFNHRLSLPEAKQKVNKIYAETKGVQRQKAGDDEFEENGMIFFPGETKRVWVGGSESHMFNKLEEIALSKKPKTPALDGRISRALEPRAVDKNFMTSRINWVVQSSAVDFLHLMLVCMKWLFKEFNIQGRFAISIHDEVRYLVRSEDRYRAALALQITNLLTRSFFTSKLGMHDLPQSVAFFSSVDIDTVLRKEVHMDSATPSNPHGLEKGYGIPPGEALDIFDVLRKTNGGKLT